MRDRERGESGAHLVQANTPQVVEFPLDGLELAPIPVKDELLLAGKVLDSQLLHFVPCSGRLLLLLSSKGPGQLVHVGPILLLLEESLGLHGWGTVSRRGTRTPRRHRCASVGLRRACHLVAFRPFPITPGLGLGLLASKCGDFCTQVCVRNSPVGRAIGIEVRLEVGEAVLHAIPGLLHVLQAGLYLLAPLLL